MSSFIQTQFISMIGVSPFYITDHSNGSGSNCSMSPDGIYKEGGVNSNIGVASMTTAAAAAAATVVSKIENRLRRLGRQKLQRNRTSFTLEQIEVLEKGQI